MTLVDCYMGIGDQFYLDAAVKQYGSGTTLWPNSGHAYQWNAKRPNNEQRYPIGLQAYSDSKYASNWRVTMAEGVDKYAWRWLNTDLWSYHVIPVMFVASDWIWQVNEVGAAASRWAHNLQRVSDWYKSQLGKGFRVCRPQVVGDVRTVNQIWQMYQDSRTFDGMTSEQFQNARYLPWNTAIKDYNAHMGGKVNQKVIYAFTHFAGPNADWDFAAAGGGAYLFVSSFATCHTLPDLNSPMDSRLQTVAYATAHEIGHCFDLRHTDQSLAPNWQQSIMQAARPPGAILCEYEKQKLITNPFFK